MTTREIIEKLPENIRERIDEYRAIYKKEKDDGRYNYHFIRAEWYGYVKGLLDYGAITDYERRVIYIYGISGM